MGPIELGALGKRDKDGAQTTAARERVNAARQAQKKRFSKTKNPGKTNSELSPREIDDLVPLSATARTILEKAGARLSLSPRAFHRVIKVARTIADLDQEADIADGHVLEALQYREKRS